jgi:hypothetical protein
VPALPGMPAAVIGAAMQYVQYPSVDAAHTHSSSGDGSQFGSRGTTKRTLSSAQNALCKQCDAKWALTFVSACFHESIGRTAANAEKRS